MTAAIHFRIDNAAPPVNIADIRWFFSSDLSTETPYEAGVMDITMVTTLPTGSLLSYAENRTSLTISNISQSDEGRYFFMATNPAGPNFSQLTLLYTVSTQYHTHTHTVTCTHIHTCHTHNFTKGSTRRGSALSLNECLSNHSIVRKCQTLYDCVKGYSTTQTIVQLSCYSCRPLTMYSQSS